MGKQWRHMLNLCALGTDIFHHTIANKAATKELFKSIKQMKTKGTKGWTKEFIAQSLFDIAKLLATSKKAEDDGKNARKGRSATNNKRKTEEAATKRA